MAGALLVLAGCGSGGDGTTEGQADAGPARNAGGAPVLNPERCRRLVPLVERRIEMAGGKPRPLRVRSSGTAVLSPCTFSPPAATVSVSLDTASESRQRFSNRLVEQI